MHRLLTGILYPFRAVGLLASNRALWRYALIPLLINIVVGALLYGLGLSYGLHQIDAAMAPTPLGQFFAGLLRVLLIVLLLVGIGILVASFGVALGAPWYAQLSERIEVLRLGDVPPEPPLSAWSILYDLVRALVFELKKLFLLIAVGLPLLLLNLLPGVGQIVSTVGGLMLGSTIACLDFFDGPLERRRLSFRQKLRVIWRCLPASAGFGLVCLGMISIPLLNLLLIPLCVAGGTMFLCDELGRRLDAPVS
jgi:CysZ protein